MGYRKPDPKPKPIRRVLQDTTTRNKTFIQNGAHAHLAIPCWYLEVKPPKHLHLHDRDFHDHIGWPDPRHHDHSCQDAYHVRHAHWQYHDPHDFNPHHRGWHHPHRYLDLSKCHPIHLLKEGYENVTIAFDDPPEGLTASGYIDEKQDWVVRFDLYPMCDDAIKKDIDVPYTVFVDGSFGTRQVRDVVAKGILRIIHGPID